MATALDYQVLLETVVMTAKNAIARVDGKADAQNRALLMAYVDVLDAVKTQAEIMEIPLSEIGLEGFDLDALLQAQVKSAA